jgi:hypothetical protein
MGSKKWFSVSVIPFTIVLVVGMLAWLVFQVIDSRSIRQYTDAGQIISKDYIAPYSSSMTIVVNHVILYHPARYSICILVQQAQQVACADVSQQVWESLKLGDRVSVQYEVRGHFSKEINITQVSY